MTGYKDPPKFDGVNFTQWRREVELWGSITKLDKKQQGIAVALTLKDTARSVATALGQAVLNSDDGLKAVLDEMNKLFGKNNIDCQYQALNELEVYARESGVTIMEYIAQFEIKFRLTVDLIGAEPYSDYMKAYKLIQNARLDDNNAKIVRSSLQEWKYDDAVTALKKIFGGECSIAAESKDSSLGSVSIKTEPAEVFYSSYYSVRRGHRGRGSRSTRGGRYVDDYGESSGCWHCGSAEHFRNQCAEYQQLDRSGRQ